MIRQAVLRRGVKLIVADPRKIDITEFAAIHIRQKPGTDVALLNGLMHIILQNAWHNKAFIRERCEGFEEFRDTVQQYPPERVAEITSDLARRVLNIESRQPTGPQAAWNYSSAAEIMDEIAAVTPSYAGVNHQRLERGDQLQWPVLDNEHAGTPILHRGQFTRGKGKFHAINHLSAKELPDKQFPLLLTTGRVLYHWHGGEQTRRSRRLLEACPETLVEIRPDDAARLGVDSNAAVRVISRRGEMLARAVVTDRISVGVIFANFHFPGPQNVNNVTISALDPIAKIPEYKVCAVRVERR